MSNVLKMAAVGGAVSAETDPNFKQTVLLLHGDGTNGAQNNTFLDSSTNNFTITRNPTNGPNAPTQGTFSPFSVGAGEWSNYFDGNGDVLTVNGGTPLTFGTGDFTIEFWVYYNGGLTADVALYDSRPQSTNGVYPLIFSNPTGKLVYYVSSAARITGTTTLVTNTWYHVALARSGTDTKLFLNGVQEGSTYSDSNNYIVGTNRPSIGATGISLGADPLNGYMSNVRAIKGTALYTTTFTPPTAPLTAISNTQLLICQSNRFVDNSTNAFAITRNGDVRVTPFSPFAPSAAYDPAVNGGSGYFDGSGDILETPTSGQFAPTGDFTIGLWFYPNSALTINQNILGNLTANVGTDWLIQMVSGTINFYTNGTTVRISSATAVVPFQWNYISMTRSSNVISAHVNGASLGTYSQSGTFGSATKKLQIGNATNNLNGYVSGIILIDGSVDTAVPTAPPTAITNTQLLLNFTNAGIFDNTGKNNLETVGNAQIDTTTKKFGTGSMEFDGTGDRLVFASTPDFQMGTGNFTIEGWIRRNDTNIRGIFQLCGTEGGLSGPNNLGLAIGSDTGQVWRIYANNTGYNSTATWAINTWYHFALVKSSGTIRLYIDGVQVLSQSDTTNYSGQFLCIGGFYDTTFLMNGFIDDLRITKGVARYPTEPFPTKAFPDQ